MKLLSIPVTEYTVSTTFRTMVSNSKTFILRNNDL